MSIIINLIGHALYEENIEYNIKINNIKIITFDVIKSYFSSFGIDEDDFEHICATCNGKNIQKEHIELHENETEIVWLFSVNQNVRTELVNIFKNNGHKIIINTQLLSNALETNDNLTLISIDNSDNETASIHSNESNEKTAISVSSTKSETSEESEESEINEINISLVNQETIKLLQDEDFVKLIKIYINKPILFKKFYMYISNGTIIEDLFDDTIIYTKNENEEELNVDFNIEIIKSLNLEYDDDTIKHILLKNKNHLNFTIRELLYYKILI